MLGQKGILIEEVEFLLRFAEKGLLNYALDILNFPELKVKQQASSLSHLEQELLQLCPLPASFRIDTTLKMETLLRLYLLMRWGGSSVCLVGERQ